MLADGARIAKTQSAVVLEKLIGQFLFDKAPPEPPNDRQHRISFALRAARWRCSLGWCARVQTHVEGRPVRAVEPRDVRHPPGRGRAR
jgi:hypothetical protein